MVGLAGLATLRRRPTLLILEVLSVALLARSFHSLSFGFSPRHIKISPLKNPTFVGLFVTNGGIGGARTRDLGLKRALLYQLSYNPEISVGFPKSGMTGVSYKKFIFCRIFFIFFSSFPLQ